MAVDRASRTVRMLVSSVDGLVDTWEGFGRLGQPKPDGTYMTEDDVAEWFDQAVGLRQTVRLCNHDECGLPAPTAVELRGGHIRSRPGAPKLDRYDPATMQRQFIEFDDGRVYRLEPGEWTPELVAATPADRVFDTLEVNGQPVNPRVRDTR